MAKSTGKRTPIGVKSARLDKLMRECEMDSVEVGEKLHVHPVTVRRWRNGTHEIPTATLEYAEYLFLDGG
jgi:hypothetical protein